MLGVIVVRNERFCLNIFCCQIEAAFHFFIEINILKMFTTVFFVYNVSHYIMLCSGKI